MSNPSVAAPAKSTPPAASPFANDPEAQKIVAAMRERSPKACPLERLPDVHPARIPRHIAIIMDGNGRWAQQKGFPRIFGHRNGARAVRTTIEEAGRLGVEVVTLYSFSAENWKRPAEEVGALMQLYVDYLEGEAAAMMREGLRFVQIGRREGLPVEAIKRVEALEKATAGNRAGTLCLAVNYSSRDEITRAVAKIAGEVKSGALDVGAITEQTVSDHLDTAGLPDPDLLIRTAGEMRVSNYLLWQLSYTELYVTDVLWPDFDIADLHTAVRAYAGRSRRFGGLDEKKA